MARKPCDWCKMRRVCELTEVLMRGSLCALASPVEFLRIWTLCSQCRKSCEERLQTAFRDVPE